MFEIVEIGGNHTVAASSACNHVYVVDVSGSMYHDLPKIRQNLKNIIGLVAQPDDTFSVIYFSGRGQCGVVFENVNVSDVSTVTLMNNAIDRYLTPIGLTGFVDPMTLAMGLNLDGNKVNNFVMMTDGYDNQFSREKILETAAKLTEKFQSISFIEYGYYADRKLIEQMAEATGGTHIFAEGFAKYETIFEDHLQAVPRVSNIEVKVNKQAKDCIFLYNGQIKIVPVTDGIAFVPADVERVHSIVPKDVLSKQLSEEHLYMILYYASKKNHNELVWNVLQALGDVGIVRKYTNAFTKQELSDFEELVQQAVLDPSKRFLEGKDLNAVPNKNAPTIVDLLGVLESNGQLVTSSPDWKYNRIGRKSEATESLPRFIPSPMSHVSMGSLVYNSDRPNISIQTTIRGTVELPENEFKLNKVPSHIYRNYTVIKDGIVNVEKLPVVFPENIAPMIEHFPHEVIEQTDGKCYWVFNLRDIPVINRSMVEKIELNPLAETIASLTDQKAGLKVLGYLLDELGGSEAKIQGMVDSYGKEAADWLSTVGVRDYGYSAVGTKSAEATDEYESIELSMKLKNVSSIPSVNAVIKKINEGKKLNVADELINHYLLVYKGLDKEGLEGLKATNTKIKRDTERQLASMVYALILGRKWFSEEETVVTDVTFPSTKGTTTLTLEKVRKMVAV